MAQEATILYDLEEEFFDNYLSEHTRKNYRIDLLKFVEFMSEYRPKMDPFLKAERKDVIKYRNFLNEAGGRDGHPCAPKTIARKLASLSKYFDFIVERGKREFNPVMSIKRPRREVLKPTNALNASQVEDLFYAIESSKSEARFLHKAILLTFFMTGLRKSEVLYLKRKNYRSTNGFQILEYVGKGGKIGQKALHPSCSEAIEEYLNWMKSVDREHHMEDWLFQPTKNPTDKAHLNKPLNPKTINEILDFYAKKAQIYCKITPHSARATFIGELLEVGVDIYSVAQEVNHSSVKTTQEYDKRRKKLENSPVFKLQYTKKAS